MRLVRAFCRASVGYSARLFATMKVGMTTADDLEALRRAVMKLIELGEAEAARELVDQLLWPDDDVEPRLGG